MLLLIFLTRNRIVMRRAILSDEKDFSNFKVSLTS